MRKIIIGIHGLGNKPPAAILTNWWKSSIEEGLDFIKRPHPLMKFELVFWADLLYPELENPQQTDPEHPLFIKEPYTPLKVRTPFEQDLSQIKRHKFISDQLDKIFLSAAGKLNFSSVTEYIIRHYFRDLDLYFSEEKMEGSEITIRDEIRERLVDVLAKHQNKEIILIAHSMGSIVALDVLNHFSDLKIDTLVTIGSPLGLAAIRSKISPNYQDKTKSPIPQTIRNHWYNLADIKDKVALDFDLADDFMDKTNHIVIKDIQIHNDFEYNGERNPHKSYGYLRTTKMAEIIHEFFMQDTHKYFQRLVLNFNNMIYRIKRRQFLAKKNAE